MEQLAKTKYKQTEVGVIPEDWVLKGLGQLAKVIGGGTPKTTVSEYWNGEISWFTPTEVGKQKYLLTSKRKITLEGLQNSSAQILPVGTILLTSRAGIGDLGILSKEAATNQGFQSLVVFDEYYNEYIYYLLSTLKPKLLSKASGSTFLEISPSKVKEISVALPPTLTEQRAIATVLSDTDALIQALEKKIAKKKLIKKGVMQELLRPKEGWEEKTLGNEVIVITKGTTPTSIGRQFTDTGINFVKVESLKENGTFRSELFAHIDSDTHSLLHRSQLCENDLLISIAGALGRSGIVSKEMLPANTNQALAIVRLKKESKINLKYLFHYLRTEQIKTHIEATSSQGAQPNLSLQDISKLQIPTPNISEQVQIAQILSDMDKEIEALEEKLAKYQLAKQGMMQQLLTGKIRLV